MAGRVAGQDETLPGLAISTAANDTVLSRADSIYIFTLMDSLIRAVPEDGSQLLIRTGYNSNVIATGRPFALGNYGLSGGVGLLHRTGFFADVSGYWSKEYSPSYFLTTATAGYLHSPHRNWTIAAEYNRYWYNLADDTYIAYTNSLNITAFWQRGKINARADYTLYFGQKTGHRLSPTLGMDFSAERRLGLDKIRLMPMASILFGTESISSFIAYSTNPLIIRARIRQGLPLFYEQTSVKAGIMNYNLSLPLMLRMGGWDFLLNYTYNIPKALPGELLGLRAGGFFACAVTRYIDLEKRKGRQF